MGLGVLRGDDCSSLQISKNWMRGGDWVEGITFIQLCSS